MEVQLALEGKELNGTLNSFSSGWKIGCLVDDLMDNLIDCLAITFMYGRLMELLTITIKVWATTRVTRD